MNFVDTHAHLYSEEFDSDRTDILKRSIEAGVNKIILPNIDNTSIKGLLELKHDYPSNCYTMMGLHPSSVSENYLEELKKIKDELYSGNKHVAVGEIGIDLYWDKTFIKEQKEAFKIQCNWANELNLPVAIHNRNAHFETIECLKQLPKQPGGVFHCFGGSFQEAMEIIELGYSLGIGGVVTYKKSNLDDILRQIDLKHIILETDSPYLPPVPYRGKRNESSYIPLIAEKLAEIYKISINRIAEITTSNAESIFNLK